jgi:hypothetical protein
MCGPRETVGLTLLQAFVAVREPPLHRVFSNKTILIEWLPKPTYKQSNSATDQPSILAGIWSSVGDCCALKSAEEEAP